MNFDNINIESIKDSFSKLDNIDDLVNFLSDISSNLYDDPKVKITKKNISYFAFHKKERYNRILIPKKNGTDRVLNAPVPFLKMLQRCLNTALNIVFTPHYSAYGFVPNKNIAQNAQQHINRNFVFNVDLLDFFSNIQFKRVKTVLELSPFNLNDELAFLIANLCCYNNTLPQGAPTSPTLSNVVCQKLDRRLTKLSKKYYARYSRYADDITFSSRKDVFDEKFVNELCKIIEDENFKINPAKTRLQDYTERQVVTGLTVNEKVNVSQSYVREIRAMLHNWSKYGYKEADRQYKTSCIEKGNLSNTDFIKYIVGKLNFLKQVKGEEDKVYQKYKNEFDKLVGVKDWIEIEINPKQVKPYTPTFLQDIRNFCQHRPLNTLQFLSVFSSSRKFSLRKLVHGDEDIDLVEELKRIDQEYQPNSVQFPKHKFQIPQTLYAHIRKNLIGLYTKEGLDIYKKTAKHPFLNDKHFTEKVFEFKKTYRFGTNKQEETLLLDVIQNAFSRAKNGNLNIKNKFDYYQILPKKVEEFNSLASFITDVTRIEYAIWIVLNMCLKHSNGSRGISFELEEHGNILIFNIIDINSVSKKVVEQFKGGDIEAIIQKLWSICDFNIIATFNDNKSYKVSVLPESNNIQPLNKKPKGFTYQLMFYKSLPKVLLIDDKFEERKYEISNDNLIRWSSLEDMASLKKYQAIIVHKSYANSDTIINECKKNNIPIIVFSGGSDDGYYDNLIYLNAKTLYNNLPSFLEEIRVNFKVNEKMLLYKNVSYQEKIQKKVDLMDEMREKKVNYSNLSSQVIIKISELLEISSEKIPIFKEKKELNNFLNKHLQKFDK
ncbi:reverse transcriptase domain-containing protein [Bernardetia sp. OM2101]|uniref:reverse transcriptase domain-containing protein n=1 Tax=Bernardetia sp. OM2101 TaxID=3344876 RepID=UPI0035CE9FF8